MKYFVEYDDHVGLCAGESCDTFDEAYAKAIEYYKDRLKNTDGLKDEDLYDFVAYVDEFDTDEGWWGDQRHFVNDEDLERIGWKL